MDTITVIVSWVMTFMYYITLPIFWLNAYLHPHQRLPPIKDKLLTTSATELAELIREKKVSSRSVVEVFINRIKDINPILNAIVEERFEDAIRQAEEVDEYLTTCSSQQITDLETTKPFLGVPITIKECCSVKGLSLAGGSLTRVGIMAKEDGEVVSRLKKAGVIPLLVSNTPELCMGMQTNNLVTGITNNPYDTTKTVGGSSGGEGALIGGGGSVIGIGSDIAGSIRIPAMFCGIFGHKPTSSIVPLQGHFPGAVKDNNMFHFSLTIGPLTRYAQDLEPMLKIISGDNFKKLNPNEEINLRKIKVFYQYQTNDQRALLPTNKSIQKAILKSVQYLKHEYNMQTERANFNFEDSLELATLFFDMEEYAALLFDEKTGKERNVYIEFLKSFTSNAVYSKTALDFTLMKKQNGFMMSRNSDAIKNKCEKLAQSIINTLGPNGVFIYPTLPEPAYYHNQNFLKNVAALYTLIFNLFGMPATHVPMGLDEKGLPIGFQVIAAPHRDRLCIAVAKEMEIAFGGWVPPS